MARKDNGAELIGYCDVFGSAGIEPDNGEAVVEPLQVTVNESAKNVGTKYAQRIHGERIMVYKEQLPETVKGNRMNVVTKKWKEVQKPFEQVVGKMESPSKRYEEPEYGREPSGKDLSPLGVLKNAFDNMDKRVGQLDSWIKVALVLGAIGFIGSVAFIASLLD